MSKNLLKSGPFLRILLENNQKLNKQLFIHAKKNHLSSVAEIFYNVFRLPLPNKNRKLFQKNIVLLRCFIQTKNTRQNIAVKNYKLISDLLYLLKPYIQILLS